MKGAAGTVGYDAFIAPATQLEQVAKAAKTGKIGATLGVIRSLAQRLDVPEEIPIPEVQA